MSSLIRVLEASTLEERKAKDIKKRLDTMASKWKAGSLNERVHSGLGVIAKELEEGDPAAAEKTQLALVVDWPALCGTWMVGLKHLISNVKESKAAHAEEDETEDDDRDDDPK